MNTTLPHRIIQAARLESLRLRRLLAESRVRSADEIAKPDLSIGYSAAIAKGPASDGFWVNVRAEAVVKDASLPAPESAVRIVADVEIRYGLPTGFDPATDEELQMFADTNGVLNAWPYLREAIQSSSQRLGFPSILLPLYRISGQAAAKPEPRQAKLDKKVSRKK